MSQDSSSRNLALLAFFAGAAVGALVVALTTPKPGPQVRKDLGDLGRRLRGKVGDLAQRGSQALEAFKDGVRQEGVALPDLPVDGAGSKQRG
jgi:hypothetical protein